jgi:hypothetical protein
VFCEKLSKSEGVPGESFGFGETLMVMAKALHAVERSYTGLLAGVVQLLQQARGTSARSVNAIMKATYWEIGRRIVEDEHQGKRRAGCGEALIERLPWT